MKTLDSVFKSQALLGVVVSSVVLFLVCLIHIKATESNRLQSFYQQLGQRLDSDRDHFFNLLLLNQNDSLVQLLNEYQLNYPLKKIEVQPGRCNSCTAVTKSLLRDVSVEPAELIYVLDESVGAIHLVPDLHLITQRQDLIMMYIVLYAAGLIFYLVLMFWFNNSIRRRFVVPIHQFLNSLDQDEAIFSNEVTTSSFLEKHALHKRVLAEQAMIEDRFLALLRRINAYQKQLRTKEIEASVGKIASQVAHDIRSPLSSLQSVAFLLKEHVAGNKDALEVINLLQLSGTRLENIANDLLVRHQGKTSSGPAVFSIHEILDELIGELRASPLGKGVVFKKQYSNRALYVLGDKTGMARALGNIIKNALEAMQGNPVDRPQELIVSTAFQDNRICIRITDTGPGIPADKIPFILQGGYTEGKADGHGIGTKVVREMVDAHEGSLNIESEVDKGSTFIIMLPMADIATQDSTMTVTIPYSGTSPICVIDDEPSMREQWRLTLKGLGSEVKTYTCWEDLDSLVAALPRGHKLQTFIVDYHFDNSEVDGIEIIRRLKSRSFTNFVLATAEYWKPAIKEAAKELNITLCPKPLPKVVVKSCHPEPKTKDLKVDSSTMPQNDSVTPPSDKQGPSILLIDDDPDIQISWRLMKGMLGVGKLTMYSTLEEMIAAATNPAEYDMCVIDKNIENSQYNGAKTLAYLKQNGARKVFLATGESQKQIIQDPEFSAVDGVITEKIPMSLEKYLN